MSANAVMITSVYVETRNYIVQMNDYQQFKLSFLQVLKDASNMVGWLGAIRVWG